MSSKHATDLAEKIQQLQADRQRHLQAMAAIDQVLAQIDQALRSVPTDPAQSPSLATFPTVHREVPRPVRHRGRFEHTGTDSVLDFIHHNANPTTAQINAHWRAEGRKGTANVTLLKLLKEGLIRREEDPAIRGSRYRLAQSAKDSHPQKLEVALLGK